MRKQRPAYPEPRAKIKPTAIFCFVGICKPHSVTAGMIISTPSVLMFKMACASAMLLRQVVLPARSGLQGADNTTVKTRVYTMQVLLERTSVSPVFFPSRGNQKVRTRLD